MSKKQRVFQLLSDGKPHPGDELAKITYRFGAVIYLLRGEGYDIQTILIAHNVYAYQMRG